MIKDPKTDMFIKFVYTTVSAIWLLIMPVMFYLCYKIDVDLFMGALMGSVVGSIALFGISYSMIKKFYKIDKSIASGERLHSERSEEPSTAVRGPRAEAM